MEGSNVLRTNPLPGARRGVEKVEQDKEIRETRRRRRGERSFSTGQRYHLILKGDIYSTDHCFDPVLNGPSRITPKGKYHIPSHM
jgi:hypothetical protein